MTILRGLIRTAGSGLRARPPVAIAPQGRRHASTTFYNGDISGLTEEQNEVRLAVSPSAPILLMRSLL